MANKYNPNCAFLKGGTCRVLINPKPCGVACAFYKTWVELAESNARSAARLRGLEPYEQLVIAEKYYGGDMPWREGGGTQ